jgi:long-subunit acyl-CoA synthetase (AMP-forming)
LLKTLKQNELGFMMHLHPFNALQVEYLPQSIHQILKQSDSEMCTLSKEEKRVADKMHEVLRKLPTRKEQSREDYDSDDNSGNDSNDNEQDSDDKLAEEVVAAKVKKTIEKHGYICDKNTIAGATSAILTNV